MNNRRMKSESRLEALWAALFYAALTAGMTWPLVTRMGSQLVGEIGDNIYFVWMIGWMQKALFQLHVNPFDVWFLNFPEGWNMAYTEITPAQLALALPFSFIGGPAFAYNAAMLLTFVLSGLGMFLWVRRLTGSSSAALVAGTIFAFIPYRFAHFLIGHLNLSGTQWFPFYFMNLFAWLDPRKEPDLKPALGAGIFLGLIGLTSQYYLYMAVLVTAVILLVHLGFTARRRLYSKHFWQTATGFGLAALPLVLLAVAPYVTLSAQGGLPDRGLGIVRTYSASPTDFLLPSTDHFLWGKWVGDHFNREMWIEGTLYIGLVSLVLAGTAWVNRRRLPNGWLLPLLGWGGLFALVMALGTDLHWNGAPVEIAVPGFLRGAISRESVPVPLPGYLMFRFFPFFAKLRALMRFGVFVLVFASAAAGMGAAWLIERARPSKRALLAAALLGLVLVDFYPGAYKQFTPVRARAVDAWLADQPGKGAVIQFPFVMGEDQDQTYYTLFHGKPFVGGFFNAFPPAQYARISPVMANFPDAQSAALLGTLGVEYVLVDRASYPDLDAVRARCEELGLRFLTEQGGQLVFTPLHAGGAP